MLLLRLDNSSAFLFFSFYYKIEARSSCYVCSWLNALSPLDLILWKMSWKISYWLPEWFSFNFCSSWLFCRLKFIACFFLRSFSMSSTKESYFWCLDIRNRVLILNEGYIFFLSKSLWYFFWNCSQLLG